MHDFVNDLRYGLRMLLKNRSFTIVTVLTLGLGLGANLTIFSFMDTLFFRPLPVHKPDQLVIVEATRAANGKLNRGRRLRLNARHGGLALWDKHD